MYVLGIETSCDETSAAIVKDGKSILSNIIASSLSFHKQYGGVIPEIASRRQLETISQVVDSSLKEAKIKRKQISLVSVTENPGLLGSLLVGLSFARSLSLGLKIPLLEVNHLESHIYANFLGQKKISLPSLALIVSGGHTNLYLVKDFGEVILLGQTLDDAAGEAFDKVAKILGLGYPGGPLIERLAKKGSLKKIKFNCSGTKNPLDFSFSGIKTAVLYWATGQKAGGASKADVAAAFQAAVINALINKSLLACKIKKINRLLVGGGVAANTKLREEFLERAKLSKVKVYFPDQNLCMDNAAMVAGLGYRLFKKGG